MPFVAPFSPTTGPMPKGSMMSVPSEQTSLPWISSAEASPAKTCPARERARALLASARASGVSSLVWSERFDLPGSLSRTSRAVLDGGSMRSCVSWKSSAMRAYLSQSRRAMSALLTSARESSLLPTLTVCGNYNRAGASPTSGDGLRTALLPTLTATSYGTTNNGTKDGVTPYATKGKPSLETMARRGMLPTLTTRDEKGPGPKHTRAGADLPQALGGHLNPEWCLWFMGFQVGWLDVNDAPAFARSATRSSRSAPKPSAG